MLTGFLRVLLLNNGFLYGGSHLLNIYQKNIRALKSPKNIFINEIKINFT